MQSHPGMKGAELEPIAHGTPMFPCICYNSWILESFPSFNLHWHPEVEFNLVIQGQAEVIVDFRSYTTREGDILLVNRKEVHGFFRKDSWDFNCKAVLFRLDFLADKEGDDVFEDYIAPLQRRERSFVTFIRRGDPVYPQLRQVLEEIFALYSQGPQHYKLLMKAKLLQGLYLLYSAGCVRATGTPSPRSRSMKQVIDFISKNYTRHIPAQEAADVAGYSKYHFLRVFKEAVGMEFTHYVNQVRLEHAAQLLGKTGLSVTEIALSVGFSDSAYFSKRFREAYHTTPLAFRRSQKEGPG